MPAHKPLIFDGPTGISRCQAPDFIGVEHLNVGGMETVPINGGTIRPAKTYSGAVAGTVSPTNRIHTIISGVEGTILILRCALATLVDNTGNIRLRSNFVMDHPDYTLVLLKSSNGTWLELARSNNT